METAEEKAERIAFEKHRKNHYKMGGIKALLAKARAEAEAEEAAEAEADACEEEGEED